jgi:hypothetical protein
MAFDLDPKTSPVYSQDFIGKNEKASRAGLLQNRAKYGQKDDQTHGELEKPFTK